MMIKMNNKMIQASSNPPPPSASFDIYGLEFVLGSRINESTVVSAYKPPGYKPTSASVPLKGFPDCFCYPLYSKVSLFSPTGYKHKPASVLRNCPPKPAKKLFVSRLLKIIC